MCLINFKLHKIKAQPFEFCRHWAQDSRFSFQVPKLCIHDSQEGHLKFFCLFVCLVIILLFFFITNLFFFLFTDRQLNTEAYGKNLNQLN